MSSSQSPLAQDPLKQGAREQATPKQDTPHEWLHCGQVGRPHGVKGALHLWPHNKATALLKPGAPFYVCPSLTDEQREDLSTLPAHKVKRYTIRAARRDPKGWVVALEELSDREQAKHLSLCEWLARREDFPALKEGEFYFADLIGAEGRLDDGRSLGALTEVLEAGAGEIFVFEGDLGEVMVPFVWDTFILSIDVEARLIEVRAVKGLVEGGL